MVLPTALPAVPLTTDPGGVVRVAGTRVTLDSVIESFQAGATAEDIAQQFPSLSLGDVYAVIAYYLQRREEVDLYLARMADASARRMMDRGDGAELRERLLARRAQRG